MTKTLVLVCAIALFGCSKKTDSGGSSCATAVAKGVDTTLAARRKMAGAGRLDPSFEAIPAKLKTVLTQLCVEDQWSPDVVACLEQAADIKSCKDKLTLAQRQRYTTEMVKVMSSAKRLRPEMLQPSQSRSITPGSAAPGSAGSAASGSAAP